MRLLYRDMRYYRLWIYLCNLVLFLGMVTFTLVAGTMLSDPRTLVAHLPMHHPTFMYAYITLVVQGGLLPAIGCYGAVRLNERWLNLYWAILLLVLVGDLVVGVTWIFIFGHLTRQLPVELLGRLQTDYGQDAEFTSTWNDLQQELRCCGVQGPNDFNASKWWISLVPTAATSHHNNQQQRLPVSCWSSSLTNSLDLLNGSDGVGGVGDELNVTNINTTWSVTTTTSTISSTSTGSSSSFSSSRTSLEVEEEDENEFDRPKKRAGCSVLILDWLRHCTHVLFVLGYCVMAFLKVCFLGILRYEIREMVQKIKILQGDMSAFPELIALGLHAPVMHPKHRLMPDYAYGRCPLRKKSFFFSFDKKKVKAKMKKRNGNNNELEMTELTQNGGGGQNNSN